MTLVKLPPFVLHRKVKAAVIATVLVIIADCIPAGYESLPE